MGMYTSAWIAYGAAVKTHQPGEDFDVHLGKYGVGHLAVGPYDHDTLYFTTFAEDADLGSPSAIPAEALDPTQCARWTEQIRHAAAACAVELDGEPGWLLIADVS